MTDENTSWLQWSQYVLKELERGNTNYEALRKDCHELSQKFESFKIEMKLKVSMYGAIAGGIPGLVIAFIWWLSHTP